MRLFGFPALIVLLAISFACGGSATPPPAAPAGPSVDPATAGTIAPTGNHVVYMGDDERLQQPAGGQGQPCARAMPGGT